MPTQVTAPVTHQVHVAPVNNDPSMMPCKSALGDDCEGTPFTGSHHDAAVTIKVLNTTETAPAEFGRGSASVAPGMQPCVPDNELDAPAAAAATLAGPGREEEFAGSKAEADMAYAMEWLAANPEALARVRAVLQQFDAKLYQRSTSSVAPFWRSVLRDLVGKAGHTNKAPVTSEDSTDSEPEDGQNEDDSFFAVDLARVIVQYAKFTRCLPRVHPHYAMKCNNSTPMIAMISALGGGFDCASKGEFRAVLDGGYQTADGIIFAHPCKMINNIQAANRRGVFLTTFDNEEELEKLARHMPKAQAVLRIATDDSAAVCEFSSKFGCPIGQTQACLERAKELGIAVVGVSFHVGSGNSSTDAYRKALVDARDIFDRAEALGFEMRLLDIGGGFSGTDPVADPKTGERALSFEEIAAFLGPKIDELFPDPAVRVIAEPGRFFAESPYAIAMSIHSKRRLTKRDGATEYQYYTSDGKYGSFNCMLYDHQSPAVHVLNPDSEAALRLTTIFGPTCDGIDWIKKQELFPALDVGDWIFCPDFGAYTVAAGSSFNGFATRRVEYVSSLDVFAL